MDKEVREAKGVWKRLVRYFAAGVFTVLPLVITVVAISWAISFMAGLVGPETFLGGLLSKIGLSFVADSTIAYALGWLCLAAVIMFVGVLVESGLRGLINRVTDAVLKRVPLVGKVYDTSQQLVNMIDSGGDDKLKGMSAVFCTFGEKGGVGVLALLPTNEIITINDHQYYIVLVPQSPVPIGGGLLFMPTESVERVEMSVEMLMSVYVSMGAVAPGSMESPSKPGDES